MLTLPNALSLLRAPLAILFLLENPTIRSVVIVLAMLTDSIDGFLARKSKATTRLGAFLDPAMDKFFVIFCLGVVLSEGRLELWEGLLTLSRDFSLCLFGLYLSVTGFWKKYEFRSILWGKITTVMQFIVLIQVTLGYQIFRYFFILFIIFALLAFVELFQFKRSSLHKRSKEELN